MSRRRVFLSVLLLVVAGVLAVALTAWFNRGPASPVPPDERALSEALGVPRGTGGRPDFAALIEGGREEGARPEDNAAVPLLRLFGPRLLTSEDGAVLVHLCERLGLSEVPAGTARWEDPWTWYEARGEADDGPASDLADAIGEAAESDWSVESRPELARYLEARRAALDGIVRAVERPRLRLPVIRDPESGALDVMPLHFPILTEAAAVLGARARLHLAAGRVDAALADVEAQWRLADRLAAQPGLLARMIAESVARAALAPSAALLSRPDVASRVLDRLEELAAPPLPPRPVADEIDRVERSILLDLTLDALSRGEPLEPPTEGARDLGPVDANLVVATIDGTFDRVVGAVRGAEAAQAIPRLQVLTADLKRETLARAEGLTTLFGRVKWALRSPEERRAVASRHVADTFCTLSLGSFAPGVTAAALHEAHRRLLGLAVAAARHRREHGRWPVAPDQVATGDALVDPRTGTPFEMVAEGDALTIRRPAADGDEDEARGVTLH